MTRAIMTIMEGVESRRSFLEGKLKKFLKQQQGEIFTLDDALVYLDVITDAKEDIDATGEVITALDKLGCHKELTTIYTPPNTDKQPEQAAQKSDTKISVRVIQREELVS